MFLVWSFLLIWGHLAWDRNTFLKGPQMWFPRLSDSLGNYEEKLWDIYILPYMLTLILFTCCGLVEEATRNILIFAKYSSKNNILHFHETANCAWDLYIMEGGWFGLKTVVPMTNTKNAAMFYCAYTTILAHAYICNGYGIWINKTKHSGFDLILFIGLRGSWRASPASWHLSQVQYTNTVTPHSITHGEHRLRVGT